MSVRILANDGLAQEAIQLLEAQGWKVDPGPLPAEELALKLKDYDVLVVRSATKVTAQLLRRNPHLKVVARAGVGLDNIDLDAARELGIKVINTPGASAVSVAELTLTHMMVLLRFLHLSLREMSEVREASQFKALKKKYSRGREATGKTLGLIGMGRIAREVARRAIGLGMRVRYYDPFVEKVELTLDHLGIQPVPIVPLAGEPLEAVLRESDVVSLHLPLMPETHHMLNEAYLRMMKPGSYLIQCARGGIVDEEALIKVLDEGHLAGAAMDVFEDEPNPRPVLLAHPKISVTPHIGASTVEAQRRIGLELAEQLIALLGEK